MTRPVTVYGLGRSSQVYTSVYEVSNLTLVLNGIGVFFEKDEVYTL